MADTKGQGKKQGKRPSSAPHRSGPKRQKRSTSAAADNDASQNRFRFKTFSERIESISIDSFRKLTGLHGLRPSNASSWLMEALEAWTDLNHTSHFQALADQLSRLTVSMAAVLFNKQAIVQALLDAIEMGRRQKVAHLLSPTCNLVTMLMQDLGEQEGYDYFQVLFEAIGKALVQCQAPEDIEACFSCLIYLLKSMKGRVLENIHTLCTALFVPLFGQARKLHLQKLACYSYSYLIRQSSAFEALDALLSLSSYPSLVKDCVVEVICLTVIDPESRRPRECFGAIVGRCAHSCSFLDQLAVKIADRLWNGDFLLRAVALDKLSDKSLVHILARSTPSSTDHLVAGLGDRLANNAVLSAALILRLNLEQTLSCRASLAKVVDAMPNCVFVQTVSIVGELKWPHTRLLFSLETRAVDDKLLCCLAALHHAGTDLDWGSMRSKQSEACPEVALEFQATSECTVNPDLGLELQVAILSQMLRRRVPGVPTQHHLLLRRRLHHPAVFCNLSEHHDTDLLLLFLTSSHVQVHRHALVLLGAHFENSKVHAMCVAVDSIPASFETYRDRVMALKQFDRAVNLSERDAALAICFLLGSAHAKLTLLWPETFRLLAVLASKHPAVFKTAFRRSFEYAVDRDRESEVYDCPFAVESEDLQTVADAVASRTGSLDTSRLHFASLVLQTKKYSILDADAVAVWLRATSSHASIAEACQPQLRYMLAVAMQDTTAYPVLAATVKANLALIIQSASLCNRYPDADCRAYFDDCAMRCLASGDAKVQLHALSLVLSLRRTVIHAEFAAELKALLDDKTGRDQLVTISNEIEKWSSNPAWSDHLLPVLLRLLHGRMTCGKKSGGSGGSSVEQRRRMVLSSIATWPAEACECFVAFLAGPTTDARRIAGFLSMVGPVFACMGSSLSQPAFNRLLHSVLDIIAVPEKKHARLRSAACKQLLVALSKTAKRLTVGADILDRVKALVIEPRLSTFEVDAGQSKSGIVDLLVFLADSDYTELVDEGVMAKVTAAIASAHTKADALQRLMRIPLGVIARNRSSILNVNKLIDAVSARTIADVDALRGEVLRTGLSIMRSLAEFISSPADARRLLEMAVGVLGGARLPEHTRHQLVTLIHRLYLSKVESVADSQLIESLVGALSSQFSSMKERHSRLAVAQVFSCFSDTTPGWSSSTASSLIQDLESWSPDALDEPDYDRRGAAMSRLRNADHVTRLHWTPILHILLRSLKDPAEAALHNHVSGLVEKCIQSDRVLCEQVILPAIKRGVVHKDEAVRFEFFALLGKVVQKWDDPRYAALRPLLTEGQEESNVFTCFGHLQLHRRARAIRKIVELSEHVRPPHSDCSLYVGVLLPMLSKHCLYNAGAGDQVPEQVVTMEAIRTVGWLCGTFLSFPAYLGKVHQLVRQIRSPKYPGAERQAVKLLPDILHWFTFDCVEVGVEVVTHKLLPLLFEGMQGNAVSGSTVSHISIAAAIGQLLSKLPPAVSDLYLPRLYCALAQTSRSRLEDERRDARDTLVKVVALFPATAGLALQELVLVLSRGYQRHVLAYTLHAVLACNGLTVIRDSKFVEQAVSIILEDTLGSIAREKKTEEWSGKLKEARECKSFASTAMLVKKIDCQVLLSVVLKGIADASRGGNHFDEQLGKLMDAVSAAVVDYPSVELLCLAHELVNPESAFFTSLSSGLSGSLSSSSRYNQVFHRLGLKVIASVVRREEKGRGEEGSDTKPERYAYLEQLCRLIAKRHWLESTDSGTIALSVKLVCLLLSSCPDLPAVCDTLLLGELLHSAFGLVVRSSSHHQSGLIATSFKYIAQILKDRQEVDIVESQLRALLQYVTANLDRVEGQQLTFSLIRAMLSRKVVSADLYTLMTELRERSVIAASACTRTHCVQCFLAFAKDYPMAAKRLKEHVAFYTTNLGYPGEGGRMACLQALEGLAGLLTEECLEDLSEGLIKALVLRIANEDVEPVRAEAERVARLVGALLTGRSVDSLSGLGAKWVAAERVSVQRAGWILLAILLPSGGARRLLAAAIDSVSDLDTHDHSDGNAQLIASILDVLQRVEVEWDGPLADLMLFPNLVIRAAVNRVLLASSGQLPSNVFDHAFKQLAELSDVHGTGVADLSVQLLLKSPTGWCEKMERLAKRAGASQLTVHVGSCLKYFGALAAGSVDDADTSLSIVRLCSQVLTDKPALYPVELKQLAQQVLDLLRKSVGKDRFEDISGTVAAARAQAQQERRVARKQMAVANPALAARLKLRGRK